MALTKAQKARIGRRAVTVEKLFRNKKYSPAVRSRLLASLGRKPANLRRQIRGVPYKKPSMPGPSRVVQSALTGSEAALHSTYNYAKALSDPFNAPLNTGIPMGQVGMGTFKTTKHNRIVFDTTAMGASQSVGGTTFGVTQHAAICSIQYSAAGSLQFYYGTGGAASLVANQQLGTPPSIPNGRLVCASIRITRIGRRDDAGIRYGMVRRSHDGLEVYPGFVSSDFFQMNYFPKTGWDVEYKIDQGLHPTQYTSEISIAFAGMLATASTFQVDYRAIVESNWDTPPANIYNTSDWQVTHNGMTRNADTNMLPEQLNSIASAAALGRFVPIQPGDQDFQHRTTDEIPFRVTRPRLLNVGIGGAPPTSNTYVDTVFLDERSYMDALNDVYNGFSSGVTNAQFHYQRLANLTKSIQDHPFFPLAKLGVDVVVAGAGGGKG